MKKLKEFLRKEGASLVGYADMSEVANCGWKSGISIGMKIDCSIVNSIEDGPNMEYYHEYYRLNNKLDKLAEIGVKFINHLGYEAIAQTRDYVEEFGVYRTQVPHKTVATRAGLGWIGKSALLVTSDYGSAVRITSILTEIELPYDKPISESLCGNCSVCKTQCPGEAISGKNWNIHIDRDEFFNALDCRRTARQLSLERMDKQITLCGKCIVACPYTQKYLQRKIV